MEFRVEVLAPCRKKVVVTVPKESVKEALDGRFQELNKSIALPGFRPGRAPRALLEARFGAHVRDEVKGRLVEDAYKKAIEGKQFAPLGEPTLDVSKTPVDPEKPFEFEFEVTTRPEFDLPTWKGVEVKVPAVAVSDDEVEAGVDRLRLGEATLESSDAPLADGDVAVVTWKATEGGAELETGSGAYYRLGDPAIEEVAVEGLAAALTGKKAGASVTVRGRAAADDPRKALAGKEFDVTVEVLEAKKFKPAELDEAFLKRHDFDDAAEMRKDVRRRILRAKERERDRLVSTRVVETLLGKTTIPVPSDLVDSALTRWSDRRARAAESEGRAADEAKKQVDSEQPEARKRLEEDLRRSFLLDKVAEAEDLTVTEQELLGAVEQISRETGRSTGELVQHFQEDPSRLAELRSDLRQTKALDTLRRAAVVVEEAPPAARK